jgi:hypothetical protein
MRIPPALLAIGVLVAAVIAGVVLMVIGFEIIGIVVALGSIPIAFAAWIMAGDRA